MSSEVLMEHLLGIAASLVMAALIWGQIKNKN